MREREATAVSVTILATLHITTHTKNKQVPDSSHTGVEDSVVPCVLQDVTNSEEQVTGACREEERVKDYSRIEGT